MMSLSRWIALIGVMVGLGCLRVAQQNALYVQGYAVGERMSRVARAATDLAWLQAQVEGLSSPAALAHAAQERHLTLVAWSTVADESLLDQPAALAPHEDSRLSRSLRQPLVAVAAVERTRPVTDDGTSD